MESDVRAVLQYVPSFRGKVFVLVMNAARMTELALAEALLDLTALQQVGVRLVLIVTGKEDGEIEQRLVDVELKWESGELAGLTRVSEILTRGQLVFIEAPDVESLGDEVITLASGVGASKLITFHPEEITDDGVRLHAISRETAAQWQGDARALFQASAKACERGIPRVHLLDETRQGVLMDELFSNEGVGAMVHSDDYLTIRPLIQEDIAELLAMIGRSIRDAHLVPRSYEEVANYLDEFLVLTVDDNVVGCVALHPYSGHCGEIACLYVKQNHGTEGYGQLLVQAAEKRAKELGLSWVFALSTRAVDYFIQQLEYESCEVSEVPQERQERLAQSKRPSLVVRKSL